MRKLILVLLVLFAPAMVWAGDFWQLTELDVPAAKAPVGVAYYDGVLYISSMGDSYHGELDGYIIRHDLKSGANTLLLQNQVNSPKSLLVFDDKIIFIDPYVDKDSGVPHVVLADLEADRIITKVALEKGFPRDIDTIDDWQNFVVSDSELGRIYLVTRSADDLLTVTTWAEGVTKAQGLAHFEDAVFVVGQAPDKNNPAENTGMVYMLPDQDPQPVAYYTVPTPNKSANVVAFKGGYLFVTDWATKRQESVTIYVVDLKTLRAVAEIADMPPPSDMVFVEDTLYMTVMTSEKVVAVKIDFTALDALKAANSSK